MDKINKIKNKMLIEKGLPQKKYAITVWDLTTKDIIYQNEGFAGLISFVEQVKSFGAEMEGQHQVMGWGHPMAVFYALDQANKWFAENREEFIETCIANGIVKSDDIERFREMMKK